MGAGEAKPSKFKCSLVELKHPKTSKNKGLVVIANDAFIAEAIKCSTTDGSVYVYVTGDANTTPADISHYTAEVYSRVYEEMLLQNCNDVHCVVSGDTIGAGLVSKAQLRGLPDVEVMYTADIESAQTLTAVRTGVGLNSFAIKNLDYGALEDNNIWFLDSDSEVLPSYKSVAVGGTFDRLHNGHRSLLTLAASVCSDTLIIGISCAELLASKKNASEIHSFVTRERGVKEFLSAVKPSLKVKTTGLRDSYGPAVTEASVEALIVSSETISGAQKINTIRGEKGIPPLKIIVVRRRDAVTLSSTFLRRTARRSLLSKAKSKVKKIIGGIFSQ
jgi:pantetheine-phosphate adenylyltransferase